MKGEDLYVRRGSPGSRHVRYERVGTSYLNDHWRPAPGVWLIGDGWQRRIGPIEDAVPVMTLAAFSRHREAIASAIGRLRDSRPCSAADLADAVIRAVAEAEA